MASASQHLRAVHAHIFRWAIAALCFVAPPLLAQGIVRAPETRVWRLDNLEKIGGLPVTVVGSPRVVQTDRGPAVEFNGSSDGLFITANPLVGLQQFTIEVVFQPAVDGQEEQRFLHFEEEQTGNRALIELRLRDAQWALDTYLRSGETGVTLLDRARLHAAGAWHVATLTYDGTMMAHYVDGVRELTGSLHFQPLRNGRTSIGVRQNRVSWFKGRIQSIRVIPRAEAPTTPLWPESVLGAKP